MTDFVIPERSTYMIRQRTKIFQIFIYLGDLGATCGAFLFAYWLRGAFPQDPVRILFPFSDYVNLLWVILLLWSVLFYMTGVYRIWRGIGFWKELWQIVKALALASLFLGFAVFALKFHFVSRIFIFLFTASDLVFLLVARRFIRDLILAANRKIERYQRILIVGTGERAVSLVQNIEKHKDLGFRILGFLSTGAEAPTLKIPAASMMGKAADLSALLEREVVDEVLFAVGQEELKNMEDLFLLCEERGITARLAVNFFPHVIAKTHLEELEGVPLLTFSTTPKNELLLLIRRILDFLGSLSLISIFSPLLLLMSLLIRLEGPGPIIYRQVRCGLNGRKFILFKFRSMIPGAEAQRDRLTSHNMMNGPVFKMKNDPRVTRVGRVLRKTSMDELPQLFNVLKGDMSFVGPRPPIPEEVEKYEGWQRRRLSMKPGITGLWQVSGRNQIDFKDWMKLDLQYIDNWSLWLDVKILLKTIPVVLFGKGAM
jgi:exopolysaccharide biosynthesis polyprenyl glycosylphosphotransferase